MKYIKNIKNAVENNSEKLNFKNFSEKFTVQGLCQRNAIDYDKVSKIVVEIKQNVSRNGDKCLRRLTKKFDGANIKNFLVSKEELMVAEKKISKQLRKAIKIAARNINKFHKQQLKISNVKIETTKGVRCWQEFRAIERVGLYIPGGTAPLFSTLLMLAIPAKIAGCKKIVLCTPPQKNGKINPVILAAAKIVGVSEIYKVGGAQAIFAMSYGTETIPKVDKIFGPGNSFVTAAKMSIANRTAIDMPAGPSEVLVIADEKSNSKFIAADLLSQAEHGMDSQCVLVATNRQVIEKVLTEIGTQLKGLERENIILSALGDSFIILVNNIKNAISISNEYAPEHLILHCEEWKKLLPKIANAGSVFCGEYAPESAGDYASGTNHTLPTSGFAKNFSGVSVNSFGKNITFQQITKQGLKKLGSTIEIMAQEEGLGAHKNAVTIRM
jgi:histidinol dehydrogenase